MTPEEQTSVQAAEPQTQEATVEEQIVEVQTAAYETGLAEDAGAGEISTEAGAVNFVNPETGEVDDSGYVERTTRVATRRLVGEMRDVILNIMRDKKTMGKAWSDMTENEQRAVVRDITFRMQDSVRDAIDVIRTSNRGHIRGLLKQITIKDGVKSVIESAPGDEMLHELFDAQGETVLIVLTSDEEFLDAGDDVEYDADQPELPVEENETTEVSPDDEGEDIDEDEGEQSLDEQAEQYT